VCVEFLRTTVAVGTTSVMITPMDAPAFRKEATARMQGFALDPKGAAAVPPA
jgi:hypothetical protein